MGIEEYLILHVEIIQVRIISMQRMGCLMLKQKSFVGIVDIVYPQVVIICTQFNMMKI